MNPYETVPESSAPAPHDVASKPPPSAAPLRPFAAVVGAAVDNAATIGFQFLYMIVLVFRLGGTPDAERQVMERFASQPHQLTLAGAGLVMSVIGGLVAGGLARRNELLHGAFAGVLSVVFGRLLIGTSTHAPPVGALGVLASWATPLTIVSATLGGYLAAVRRQRVPSA